MSRITTVFAISLLLAGAGAVRAQSAEEGIVLTPKRAGEFRPLRLRIMPGESQGESFSASEQRLLREADRILNEKFTDASIIEQAMHAEPWLAEKAKKLTRVENCFPEEYRFGDKAVIMYQWLVLVVMQGFGGFEVDVHPYFSATDGYLGVAPVDVVDFDLHCSPGQGLSINGSPGDFEISINRFYLADTDATELAGTVLHEVLHNLGHQHPKESRDRTWQINAFADALGLGWISEACELSGSRMRMAATP